MTLRICVVGDGLAAGIGDPKGLGWTGRVAARTPCPAEGLAVFPLGIPDEGTAALLERWRRECYPRFAEGGDNRLVVALGAGDLDDGTGLARSRLNLANILDDARADGIGTLVVGPVPGSQADRNGQIEGLSDAFAEVCERRGVPFIDCFAPLVGHEQWHADLSDGDGRYPGQVGYGLIAWLVLHQGWQAWVGAADPG